MKLSEFLDEVGSPVPYYPKLAHRLGGVNPCVFLCSISWKDLEDIEDRDGWIELSMSQIENMTGLSMKEQRIARKKLRLFGILEEKRLRLQHKTLYRVNVDKLNCLLVKLQEAV